MNPQLAIAHHNLSTLLRIKGKLTEAQAHAEQGLAINPNDPSAHGNLAAILRHRGKFDEALACFDLALSIMPTYVEMYYDRASLKTFAPGDADLAAMQALAANPARLPPGKRHFLHFALGKALDDIGQYDRAFAHSLEGNKLKRQQVSHDGQEEQLVRRLVELFTPELWPQFATAGDPSPVPIFIVGMPRSGTSLIEQILCSHPLVEGGGELPTLGAVVRAVRDPSGRPIPYPLFLAAPHNGFRKLGQRYLASLPPLPAGKTRMTDKLPFNFQFAGLIHLALPNARSFTSSRSGRYLPVLLQAAVFGRVPDVRLRPGRAGTLLPLLCGAHGSLAAVLPQGTMFEVRYEEVVDDLERQARRMLDFCGLQWDPACLAFHKNERLVMTPSDVQVRQPIYRCSVGRWRHYEQHLGPLLAELGDLAGRTDPEAAPKSL